MIPVVDGKQFGDMLRSNDPKVVGIRLFILY